MCLNIEHCSPVPFRLASNKPKVIGRLLDYYPVLCGHVVDCQQITMGETHIRTETKKIIQFYVVMDILGPNVIRPNVSSERFVNLFFTFEAIIISTFSRPSFPTISTISQLF